MYLSYMLKTHRLLCYCSSYGAGDTAQWVEHWPSIPETLPWDNGSTQPILLATPDAELTDQDFKFLLSTSLLPGLSKETEI